MKLDELEISEEELSAEKRERQQNLQSEMERFFTNHNLKDFLGKKQRMSFQGFDQTRYGKELLPAEVLETGLQVEGGFRMACTDRV